MGADVERDESVGGMLLKEGEWLRKLHTLERQGGSLSIEVVLKDDQGNAAGSLAFSSAKPHRGDILLQVGATLEELAHRREGEAVLAERIASEARASIPTDDLMTKENGEWRALTHEERTKLGLGRMATPEIEP